MLLAIDTAYGFSSVALLEHSTGEILTHSENHEKSQQAEILISQCELCLKEAEKSVSDLSAIVVNVGPGSFTGLRIGLAAAKGIALAKNIPIHGITSLEAHAFETLNTHTENSICIAKDAGRGHAYTQTFKNDGAIVTPQDQARLVPHESISHSANIFLASDFQNPNLPTINAQTFARLAHIKLEQQKDLLSAEPVYIRKPDAELPKKSAL